MLSSYSSTKNVLLMWNASWISMHLHQHCENIAGRVTKICFTFAVNIKPAIQTDNIWEWQDWYALFKGQYQFNQWFSNVLFYNCISLIKTVVLGGLHLSTVRNSTVKSIQFCSTKLFTKRLTGMVLINW